MHATNPNPFASSGRQVPLFPLGRLVATPGAIDAMAKAGHDPLDFLSRHRVGDWGDVDEEDWKANDAAIVEGGRMLSAYTMKDGVRLWAITEADRSSTCILLPEEY